MPFGVVYCLLIEGHLQAYSVCLCAGDIRLVGSSDPSEGRIELFYEGQWGRVVIDWTRGAAVDDVACQQTGYPYSEGLQLFRKGSGPVWLVIFECTGDEERVEQCEHDGWRSIYIYSFPLDIGVRCRGKYEKDTHAHCDKVPKYSW